MSLIEGVYPALLTTFDNAGNLDPKRYERLINRCYDKGVHGLYACGVTGEGLLMRLEERELAAEIAIEASKGRGRAIIHIGCATTADAVRLARHAAKKGAAAVGCLAPFAGHFGADSVIAHFRAVAKAAEPLPALVYYTPQSAPSLNSYALVERLMEIPNIAGLKFTATDTSEFATAMFEYGSSRTVLCGVDEMFVAALFMGAHGAIGSFVNIAPEWFLEIYSLAQRQRWEEAKAAQHRLIKLIRVFERYPFISALKHAVAWQGLDCGEARPPHQPLSEAQDAELRAELSEVMSAATHHVR